MTTELTLEQHRENFANRRLIAMPLAGTVVWALMGIANLYLDPIQQVWCLYMGTGSIFYVGMVFMRFTGEHAANKSQPKNPLDTLFLSCIGMAFLVFAIVIPFAQMDYTALPLGLGVLTGIMWLPISWLLRHWVGVFHAVVRTLLVVLAWYLAPEHRFTLIPLIVVGVYLVSIVALEIRWRRGQTDTSVTIKQSLA